MEYTDAPNTIVVIEDIDTITKLFTILLKKAGFSVVSFATGESAVEWMKTNRPTLVLCDIMLPGMTGVDVLRTVRTFPHGKDLPMIAVTALAMDGDRENLLASGFTDYIPKPINSATFVSQITAHIAS